MFRTFLNIWKIPELSKKLLFTLGLLAIYRIGFYVPIPGVNQEAMTGASGGGLGDLAEYFAIFTGGNLSQSTIFGLGIMPYISASIIFQLLATVVPSLEKLTKEGESGRRKINEYTRYATVALCIIQGSIWMRYLFANGYVYAPFVGSFSYFFMGLIMLTTGTLFLMWLGEQIDEYGIGNGISLIIMAGIVARLPVAVIEVFQRADLRVATADSAAMSPPKILFLVISFVAVVAGSILITQGQRRIPIQQAKQMRGRRVYGGQKQYLPLRVNHGGVMPIIFASTLLTFPGMIFQWLANIWVWAGWRPDFWLYVQRLFAPGEYVYVIAYVGMVYFFAYFWTTVQFRPKEMAENLREYGSFIPGLRPGKRTADYLEKVMGRITYVGAAFLAVIALIPGQVAHWLQIPFSVSAFLGGTGLLIVVSVALDLVQRIEANLIMRNYKGFLGDEGRIRGRQG